MNVPSLILGTLVLLFASGAARAQEDADVDQLEADGSRPHRIIIYPALTNIKFDELGVEALPERPGITMFREVPRASFKPLTHVRADFDPEMAESLAQVR